ncbi:hypothetical protein [Streptomyces sp. CO7]
MRKRHLLMSAALLACGLTPLTAAGAQAAAGTPGDIDKDGYRDLVVSAPDATVSGRAKAGAVVVLYGGAQGVDPKRRTVLTQNSTGIPGAAEAGDRFGASVVVHDLNADGYGDLVVGAPGEEVNGDVGGGSVTVVWGSASGPTKAKTVPDPWPYEHDAFGGTLAVGTFDSLNPVNGGRLSIAVGASDSSISFTPADLSESSGTNGTTADLNPGHGVVALTTLDMPGSDDRLVIHGRGHGSGGWGSDGYGDDPRAVLVSPGGFGDTELSAGTSSAVGDLDGDGFLDLVVGNPEDPSQSPGTSLGGQVTVHFGIGSGGTPNSGLTISQATAGIPGAGEAGDRFGASVAIGDTDKDGRADLVIGTPGENGSTGAVTVVRGTADGLDTAHARNWMQSSAGVPGAAEGGDAFGTAVQLVDVNKDGTADLLVGAPGENNRTGGLWVLRGSASSVTATGSVSVTPASVGLGTAGAARFAHVVTGR